MANENERITRLEARMDALRDDVDAIIREQENSRNLPTAIARIEVQIVEIIKQISGIVKKFDDKKGNMMFAITTIIAMINTLLVIYLTFMVKR